MLQKVNGARLAAIGRCKHVWQVRQRLGFPDAKARLKRIALIEERIRAGEPPPVKPRREIRQASPVDEDRTLPGGPLAWTLALVALVPAARSDLFIHLSAGSAYHFIVCPYYLWAARPEDFARD